MYSPAPAPSDPQAIFHIARETLLCVNSAAEAPADHPPACSPTVLWDMPCPNAGPNAKYSPCSAGSTTRLIKQCISIPWTLSCISQDPQPEGTQECQPQYSRPKQQEDLVSRDPCVLSRHRCYGAFPSCAGQSAPSLMCDRNGSRGDLGHVLAHVYLHPGVDDNLLWVGKKRLVSGSQVPITSLQQTDAMHWWLQGHATGF